ncbi:hypothetical protein [Vulcanisaeta souniana]|uniref:DUF4443 domain-containing protein n=1 Tax=Vulcanisaeta souniana JCM 11219 TaxID=1293586 RepID=A0A830E8N9_9CREN|nr:hypothetical protein [Vulcanisaeta souniana]BDR92614.1 hypothetical protein Vsou_17070 [Vulcanisaeta souniana JCM 11219]GGI82501.1 hypothetical protein GCM10007112_19080 [Vulcanisaeta souniana JCM 11219]
MSAEELTVLLILKRYGRMGRYSLSSVSGMGEGVIRRVLSELKVQGAVRIMRGGAELTAKGEELLRNMLHGLGIEDIREVNGFFQLFKCECRKCYASLIMRDINEDSVVRLRDIAIKNGSDAILFLKYVCPQNRFLILKLNNYLDELSIDASRELLNLGNISCDKSVMVVCGSRSYQLIRSLINTVISI